MITLPPPTVKEKQLLRQMDKLGAPKESWLRSDNALKFAKAMSRCQHDGAFCAQDGFCHYDGKCFKTNKKSIEDRLLRLEKTIVKLGKIIDSHFRGVCEKGRA